MQELVNQSKAAPQSPSVPKQPGPPVMTSDPNMLSNEEATAHVSKKGTVDAYFLQQQCTGSALLMKICCSLVVWADTRSGPEVSGWAVSHRSVQLADSGRPDWQAARGSVSVHVGFFSVFIEIKNAVLIVHIFYLDTCSIFYSIAICISKVSLCLSALLVYMPSIWCLLFVLSCPGELSILGGTSDAYDQAGPE